MLVVVIRISPALVKAPSLGISSYTILYVTLPGKSGGVLQSGMDMAQDRVLGFQFGSWNHGSMIRKDEREELLRRLIGGDLSHG